MISGNWKPGLTNLKNVYYGPGCVAKYLLNALERSSSKVFIITGNSLATKTPLVHRLETLLGDHHAGTFSEIRQHGPLEDVDRAVAAILSCGEGVETILSLGGGSPIDTAKVISLRVKETRGTFLTHLTVPTTLSAAECTSGGGYTKPDGVKIGFRKPEMGVSAIFYDSYFAQYTPKDLWLSTGMRAMDHAIESYASSGLKGENLPGGMGLSHSLGYALGSPYNIPHGFASCMTLGKVIKLKAHESRVNASQIARLLGATGGNPTGDDLKDALEVGDRVLALVQSLKLDVGNLSSRGISSGEVQIIVQRALSGITEGPLYKPVEELVQSLF
uniref:Lactaldehyde reductase n=1 Tax=Talaromyces marneffei PM1 TaxID=1077442 RepID=A0A093UY23_TALMA